MDESQAAYRLCYAAPMRVITILAVVVAAGIAAAAQAPQPWNLKVQPLELATQRGSSGVQLTTSKKGVLVSWLDMDNDEPTLKFAERMGAGWTQPGKVASGEDWFVTEADLHDVFAVTDIDIDVRECRGRCQQRQRDGDGKRANRDVAARVRQQASPWHRAHPPDDRRFPQCQRASDHPPRPTPTRAPSHAR